MFRSPKSGPVLLSIEEYESDSDDEYNQLVDLHESNFERPIVNDVRPKTIFHKTNTPIRRSFNRTTTPRTKFSNQKVNTAGDKAVIAVGGIRETAVKPSAAEALRKEFAQETEDLILQAGAARATTIVGDPNKERVIGAIGYGERNRSRIGINKWYQSFALRNFDLEDMEFESTNSNTTSIDGDTSSKEMLAIDGVGFDWSDVAEEQVQTNMALMAFSDSKCDDLIVKLNQTEFTIATYKRGLATVEEQLITYRKNEVLFSEEVAVLKREVTCKDYEINVLKSEFEKVKEEKEGIEFKIGKFDKALKDLDQLPKKLDLSYFGLDEFKEPEFKGCGPENSKQESNIVCDKKSDDSKKNSDNSLVKEQVSKDTSSFVESSLNVDERNWESRNLYVKSTSTPVDLEKPLVKDGDANDVDVHLYRYMIGSLMYLTTSRPDFMFACKKQIVVATSTTKAEYVAAASCCGQVLWIQNQLLDYGYNFMNTAINIDNNNLLTKGFDAGRFQYLVSKSKTSRHVKRGRDTKIPQSSGPFVKVGDDIVHKELGNIMERFATTASSLEAEQDSGNIK
ncbi:hypothetical protein Tco_0409376 [Tanacetum coccineum]